VYILGIQRPLQPKELHDEQSPYFSCRQSQNAIYTLGRDQTRTMQIMAANEHISIDEPDFEENLRVILEEPPVQDQVLLWRALRKTMRLAAYYRLTTVHIDPLYSSDAIS
jgi:hypothetical protein